MKNNPKHVVVAVSMKSPASRQVLRGIYRFVADFGDWNITLVRGRETAAVTILAAQEWIAAQDWSKGEEPSPVQIALKKLRERE